MQCLIPFNEDDIFFDQNIGSNDEMTDSFASESEDNVDDILYNHIIGSNEEMPDSFSSSSERSENDILFG